MPPFPPNNQAPQSAPDGASMPPAPPGRVRLPPSMQAIPPDVADAHIDPNDPVQMELLHRIGTLSPQEAKTLVTGVSPQAAAVLKRLLPEVGFMIDQMLQRGARSAAPGAMPPMPAGAAGPPPAGNAPPQFSQQRPKTALGRI